MAGRELRTGTTTEQRQKSDSPQAEARAFAEAFDGKLEPPACCHLRPEHAAFWDAITTSRAPEEWSDADLILAAELARIYCDIEAMRSLMDSGGLVKDSKGFLSIDPAVNAIDALVTRQVRIYRQLKLGVHMSRNDLAPLRRVHAKARENRDAIVADDPDGLLARPVLNS